MAQPQISLDFARPVRHRLQAVRPEASEYAEASDLGLVRRAQCGERRAFDLLVLKYQQRVVKLAMRYTRNHSDAEDVAQETFIKAFRGLRHFRYECAFYTWLHRIAINSAKDVLVARSRDRAFVRSEFWAADDPAGFPTRLQELETPEGLTVNEDIRGMVSATLQALPETHRTAITLREIDGLTYEAIAATMAIPIGTVRSRVFRAREVIDSRLRLVVDGGLGRRGKRRARAVRAPAILSG